LRSPQFVDETRYHSATKSQAAADDLTDEDDLFLDCNAGVASRHNNLASASNDTSGILLQMSTSPKGAAGSASQPYQQVPLQRQSQLFQQENNAALSFQQQ